MSNEPVSKIASQLSRLPGIGGKSAQRLAYHILNMPQEQARELATAIWDGRKNVRTCSICGDLTVSDPCPICSSPKRNARQICVVRDTRDVPALEQMRGAYSGLYHILHGTLSPMDGVGPNDIRVKELMERLVDVDEVILATNPDVEGEATASYLARLIKPLGVKVTRIAYGLPVGADLEYADGVTLQRAFEGRREV
ncbi:MAG: recombination mediator RecR [Oscillospiraceae bacterium]|jgi:recombination protein RecR|nr:recombination mediator RecR [Oscillospiraceae bacterium]